MLVAVLDACVLYQTRLTGLLLHLARAGAFQPAWSDAIHAEWLRNLRARPDVAVEDLEARRDAMLAAFPGTLASVDPFVLVAIQAECRNLAQRRDAHVIAAAVAAGASVIVTHNTRDFPQRLLGPYRLAALRPDAFCAGLLGARPDCVVAGVRADRLGFGLETGDYLGQLCSYGMGMTRFAKLLGEMEI